MDLIALHRRQYMLTPIDDIHGDNIIAFTASGKITDADYKQTLTPAIEEAIKQHGNVRLLMHLGPKFDGYTAQAVFDDITLGIKHIKEYARVAVVTDNHWFAQGMKMASHLLPFDLRAFGESEMADAKKWISE